MKLEKREITLNEADSLKDVFCLEKSLVREYEETAQEPNRKEVFNTARSLIEETLEDMRLVKSLWEKSKAEQV